MSDVLITVEDTPVFEDFTIELAYRFRPVEKPETYYLIRKLLNEYDLQHARQDFFMLVPRMENTTFKQPLELMIDSPDFCLKYSPHREIHKEFTEHRIRRVTTIGPYRVLKGHNGTGRWNIDYPNCDICSIWNISLTNSEWPLTLYIPELRQQVTIVTQPGEVVFFRGNLCAWRRPKFKKEEHLYFSMYYNIEKEEII